MLVYIFTYTLSLHTLICIYRSFFSQLQVCIKQFWEKLSELPYVNLQLARKKKTKLWYKKLQLQFFLI